jgi:hypothetical protein
VLQTRGVVAPDRLQGVRGLQRVGDIADREARRREAGRIGDDLDLFGVAGERAGRMT